MKMPDGPGQHRDANLLELHRFGERVAIEPPACDDGAPRRGTVPAWGASQGERRLTLEDTKR
jgi:hypothetical protein